MVRIGIRNALEQHPILWTVLTFVGFWLTAYFCLWRSGSRPQFGIPHPPSNIYSNRTEIFFMDSDLKIKEDPEKGQMIKIMTWNLQGLMREKLEERTESVISTIRREAPDAVFFQELIPSSYEQIREALKETYSSASGAKSVYSGYFTGIFFNKYRFKKENHEIIKFANSVMDRALLIVKLFDVARPKLKLALLTSHLESLPRFKEARLEQLNQCFSFVNSLNQKYNVVFGGDLNLQDGEEEGLVPDGIKDAWKECGSSETLKYTWDMRENINEQISGVSLEEQPRERYDRLYFRSSTPKSLDLMSLQLMGQKTVEGTLYFPSDHWALLSTFQLTEESKSQNRSVCVIG